MESKHVNPDENYLEQFAGCCGQEWAHIQTAAVLAGETRAQIAREVGALVKGTDVSLVVFGSLARGEFTTGSDVDWTLLADGKAVPEHMDISHKIEDALVRLALQKPGREGTFGELANSHDLLHKIGGSDDTNHNTTQRLLLLLESEPIGDDGALKRVKRNILRRYIEEDFGFVGHLHENPVPRFFQNDVTRYWRTIAVDFAYKRRARRGEGWALRTAKLRLSRKLTYSSGLLTSFAPTIVDFKVPHATDEFDSHPLVDFLADFSSLTPLASFAWAATKLPKLQTHVASLISNYDSFLALLGDQDWRKHMEVLDPDKAMNDARFGSMRDLSHSFQDDLQSIFLEDNGTVLPSLTKTYGVF